MRKLLTISLITILVSCPAASAVRIIPAPVESWTCYDHSVNFARENPEWGIVTLYDNSLLSHMVNYQVDGADLQIHDGMYSANYTIFNYTEVNDTCFHFWLNGERPVRNYVILRDNRHDLV